jgi:hypothetical protein
MSEIKATLKGEASYERTTKTLTLDRRVFKVCEVKEERLGTLRRKILFVHFDGKIWNILHSDEDFTDIKYYKLR